MDKEWTHIRVRSATLRELEAWMAGCRGTRPQSGKVRGLKRKMSLDEAIQKLLRMALAHRERGRRESAMPRDILEFPLTGEPGAC